MSIKTKTTNAVLAYEMLRLIFNELSLVKMKSTLREIGYFGQRPNNATAGEFICEFYPEPRDLEDFTLDLYSDRHLKPCACNIAQSILKHFGEGLSLEFVEKEFSRTTKAENSCRASDTDLGISLIMDIYPDHFLVSVVCGLLSQEV